MMMVFFLLVGIMSALVLNSGEIYPFYSPGIVEGKAVVRIGLEELNTLELNRNTMNIHLGNQVLTASLVGNSSAEALKKALLTGPITIEMVDYGRMEKVGSLGINLPKNDEYITAEAGDIILYQGHSLVIYYASNTWSFTRLGKIENISGEELKTILGKGSIEVTLSFPDK